MKKSKLFLFCLLLTLLSCNYNKEIESKKEEKNFGFESKVSENCFWCGRHIDLNSCSVVVLYNKNKNTDFIPKSFSIVSGKDTSNIDTWKYFLTEILCSQKCYQELKNTYFPNLKDSHIVVKRGEEKWDYYYFLTKE